MTFDEFVTAVEESSTHWRRGQTYFNLLYAARPVLANHIRGTDLDPFHYDDRIGAFKEWLRTVWDVSEDGI